MPTSKPGSPVTRRWIPSGDVRTRSEPRTGAADPQRTSRTATGSDDSGDGAGIEERTGVEAGALIGAGAALAARAVTVASAQPAQASAASRTDAMADFKASRWRGATP